MGLATEIAKNEFLRDYFQQAEARGREEGLAEGRSKGLAEGRSKGLVEGRTEGAASATRASLRTVLETRFGRLPAWAAARIAEASPTNLDGLLRKAVNVDSLEALLGGKARRS